MYKALLRVRGARTHNLCGMDLDLHLDQITLVCGPSGCGKTSLILDTIHAESQRLYLESLGASSLWNHAALAPAAVDSIEGLRPSIALRTSGMLSSERATVGSLAECAPPLRALFARLGKVHCPYCKRSLPALTAQGMTLAIANFPQGSRLQLLAPVPNTEQQSLGTLATYWLSRGFLRARVHNSECSLEKPEGPTSIPPGLSLVVDRILLKEGQRTRIADAVDKALGLSGGVLEVLVGEELHTLATHPTCPEHGSIVPALTPAHFNPDQKAGACPQCRGSGANPESSGPCSHCGGLRISPLLQQVLLHGLSWRHWMELPLEECVHLLEELPKNNFAPADQELVRSIVDRLRPLLELGLGYLSLHRSTATLSQGEIQRIRLAAFASGKQSGLLFILDEPGAGLHPRDCPPVLRLLHQLRERGNAVVCIEHREAFVKIAENIVELGPGAGELGGRIVAQGSREEVLAHPDSRCGAWMRGDAQPVRTPHRPCSTLSIHRNIRLRSLDIAQLQLPASAFILLEGVSGAGKSTLLHDVLLPSWSAHLDGKPFPAGLGELQAASIEAVVAHTIGSERPAPRSFVATATDCFTALRELFAALPTSRARGWAPSRFTLQSKGGRCEHCKGTGIQESIGAWLPDREVPCPICQGRRFREETLEVHWKGLDLSQILELGVAEAGRLFADHPVLGGRLNLLSDLGLGYLRLGQPLGRCSSGERQRLRLGTDLSRTKTPRTLYLLDEPARGLFFDDVERLVDLFGRMTAQGHTLVVADHHPQLASAADWRWELGPGAGPHGGQLLRDEPNS